MFIGHMWLLANLLVGLLELQLLSIWLGGQSSFGRAFAFILHGVSA